MIVDSAKVEKEKPRLAASLLAATLLLGCAGAARVDRWINEATQSHQAGDYLRATVLMERALRTVEQRQGADAKTAEISAALSVLYFVQGRLGHAAKLSERAVAIEERLGNERNLAEALKIQGGVYAMQGRLAEAEPVLRRSVQMRERLWGPDHPEVAEALGNLGAVYIDSDRKEDASRILDRALSIYKRSGSPDPVYAPNAMVNRAKLHSLAGESAEAERLFKEALAIRSAAFGKRHPQTANIAKSYAAFLKERGRTDEAAVVEGASAINH